VIDFEGMIEEAKPMLERLASSWTHSKQDAEDLYQETVTRAYGAFNRFDGQFPRAWLRTIMRNLAISKSRSKESQVLPASDSIELEEGTSILTANPLSTESLALSRLFDPVLANALAKLPNDQARAVVLVDVEGVGGPDAAKFLDIPFGTLMSRLHRGRTTLRSSLRRTEELELVGA
jgi:RNA polymerase sigma-70 factor, ECF subfamily